MPQNPPTAEQDLILEAGTSTSNLMIKAYAGTGKTTTLVMLSGVLSPSPTLALAFNVKNKKDLETRLPSHFTVKTFNGLGHSAFAKAIGKSLTIDQKKIGRLVTQVAKANNEPNLTTEQWTAIRQTVSDAMIAGLVPKTYPQKSLVKDQESTWAGLVLDNWSEPDPLLMFLARETLCASIQESFQGTISFDDQIYMSALFGGVFPRFPLVIVDEAQDLSVLNHMQVARSSSDRLIVVGDPKQAIYAFRGADSSSMEKLRSIRKDWVDLKLSLTFRCPKIIVQRQLSHAPGYQAAEHNRQGSISSLPRQDQEHWTWEDVPQGGTVAVLCRNNAPLLAMAMNLLQKQISCVMLGRDIGKNLIALSKQILKLDDIKTLECCHLVNQWKETQISLAKANETEHKISSITDRAECLLAVLNSSEEIKTSLDLRNALTMLFSREVGKVTLSSIHKAKGLEWTTVLHLDPWRIPSKHARAEADGGHFGQMEQELNLRYVCETRTKENLILASLETFQ